MNIQEDGESSSIAKEAGKKMYLEGVGAGKEVGDFWMSVQSHKTTAITFLHLSTSSFPPIYQPNDLKIHLSIPIPFYVLLRDVVYVPVMALSVPKSSTWLGCEPQKAGDLSSCLVTVSSVPSARHNSKNPWNK